LEVLIAAFVMVTAIGSSLYALGRGFAALDSARCISYASQIMQSELEKMRLTQWSDILTTYTPAADLASATPATVNIDPTFFNSTDIGSRMTMTKVACWAPGHTAAGDQQVVLIKLTITWTTRDKRKLSRSYITYYGKNGLYDYLIA
jgi:hypothetical protein